VQPQIEVARIGFLAPNASKSGADRGHGSKRDAEIVAIQLHATIRCPFCEHQKREQMQQNACRFFYTCERCGARLKPKPGDCCVFCSYGDVPCPPIQEARAQQGFACD
jgi:hypothetical protein